MNECDCVSGSKCCQALVGRGRRERPGEGRGGAAVGLPVEIECKCRGNLCHTRLRTLLNIAARYAASLEPQKPKRQRQPPCHMPPCHMPPCHMPPCHMPHVLLLLSRSHTQPQVSSRQAGWEAGRQRLQALCCSGWLPRPAPCALSSPLPPATHLALS